MQKNVEFREQIQYFRRNYDEYAVEQTLMITEELKSMGNQIKTDAGRVLDEESYADKNEKIYVKTVNKQMGKVIRSLDKLEQYVRSQDYKRRSAAPGGHSQVETQYFHYISSALKKIHQAKKYIS
jgi:hypothetical protein